MFCQGYVTLGNIGEAAKLAGYTMKSAYKLLMNNEIKQLIQNLYKEETHTRHLAMGGLSRLAFGDISDALSILLNREDDKPVDLSKMDLFCISKIRLTEKGDIEVSFHDRQKALCALLELADEQEKNYEGSFISALEHSAKSLNKTRSDSA